MVEFSYYARRGDGDVEISCYSQINSRDTVLREMLSSKTNLDEYEYSCCLACRGFYKSLFQRSKINVVYYNITMI